MHEIYQNMYFEVCKFEMKQKKYWKRNKSEISNTNMYDLSYGVKRIL